MARKLKVKPVRLIWPKEPTLGKPSATLGARHVWTEADNLYRIEHFPGGTGEYICISRDGKPDDDEESDRWLREKIVARKRSLSAAQKACKEHAKDTMAKTQREQRSSLEGIGLGDFEVEVGKHAKAVSEVVAKIAERGALQGAYNVAVNAPCGINCTPQDTAITAVASGLASYLEWDVDATVQAAIDLLEQSNCHREAALLESHRKAGAA